MRGLLRRLERVERSRKVGPGQRHSLVSWLVKKGDDVTQGGVQDVVEEEGEDDETEVEVVSLLVVAREEVVEEEETRTDKGKVGGERNQECKSDWVGGGRRR